VNYFLWFQFSILYFCSPDNRGEHLFLHIYIREEQPFFYINYGFMNMCGPYLNSDSCLRGGRGGGAIDRWTSNTSLCMISSNRYCQISDESYWCRLAVAGNSHYACRRRVVVSPGRPRMSHGNKQRLKLDVSRCIIYLLLTRRVNAYCICHTYKWSNNWSIFINHYNVSSLFET